MRRTAALVALAAALVAASSAAAGFQPVRRTSGEQTIPRVRAGTIRVPSRHAAGRARVIVRLAPPPLAARIERVPASVGSSTRLNVRSASSRAYLARLAQVQRTAVAELHRAIPEARVGRRFRIVLDGITVELPVRRLPQLVGLPFADKVYPSLRYAATLDASPQLIGAPQLTAATGAGGEGMKIAVVDTGVDFSNPFFAPAGYAYPPGFPKGDAAYTSAKVIVARSFPGPGAGADGAKPVVPEEFHGTHVAGIAAGNAGTTAPAAQSHPAVPGLSGVAPHAWIGNYRVFTVPTPLGNVANSPEIVAAFEAAVADGMNVINFSGGGPQTDPANDVLVEAVRNVAAAGVVPVIAAGNDRDDFGLGSVGSPGTAPDAIAVAAVTNSHIFDQPLTVSAPGVPPALTQIAFEPAAGGRAPAAWASDQTLVDVGSIVGTDGRPVDRYLCAPPGKDPNDPASTLPKGALSGMIALVSRGNCAFVTKAERAGAAGAIGLVLVDNRSGNPNPIPVSDLAVATGMVSDADGANLRTYLATTGGRTQIRVGRDIAEIVTGRSGTITSFSSGGPTDYGHLLKPDVSAPGAQILSSTPPASTRSTFFALDGTSMATPHVSGAAALLLQRHPSWTAREVKSALVSAAGPAWADTARTQEAPVLLEGGGLVDLRRSDDPQLFTDPVSLSFGDLDVAAGAKTSALLLTLRDAGDGAGAWEIQLRPQSATAGASLEVQTGVTFAPGGTATISVDARAAADAAVGNDYGFIVLEKGGAERRVPYFFAVTRPTLPLAGTPVPLEKTQTGDTRTGASHVSAYLYPEYPFGPPPSYSGPGMNETGSEHVYTVTVDQPAANVGASVTATSANALVHPWFLGSLDENTVLGYGGTPVNVNEFSIDARFDVGAAGVVFPRRGQTFYVAVDSGSDRLTGKAYPGRYVLNSWVNDVRPPALRLVTTRVAAGRPTLALRALDAGSGVDPLSLVIGYSRTLVGAAVYDPVSGIALFPLPSEAPKIAGGRARLLTSVADFEEAKNLDTPGGAILPNTTFKPFTLTVVNAPALTWLAPDTGACVGAREPLVVVGGSIRKVRSVRFLADGRRIAEDKTGPGGLFTATWKTKGAANGRHVVTAVLTDAGGKTATAARTLRVCAKQ